MYCVWSYTVDLFTSIVWSEGYIESSQDKISRSTVVFDATDRIMCLNSYF